MPRPVRPLLCLGLLIVCAAPALAQEAPADTLAAAPEDTVGYRRCVADLERLGVLAATIDSLKTVQIESDEQLDLLRVGAVDLFEESRELLGDLADRVPELKVAPERADSVRAAATALLAAHLEHQWEAWDHLVENVGADLDIEDLVRQLHLIDLFAVLIYDIHSRHNLAPTSGTRIFSRLRFRFYGRVPRL